MMGKNQDISNIPTNGSQMPGSKLPLVLAGSYFNLAIKHSMGLSKKVKRGPSSTVRVVSLTALNCTIVRCLPKWQSKRKHLGQPGFEPDTTASSPSFKKNFKVVFPTTIGGRPACVARLGHSVF